MSHDAIKTKNILDRQLFISMDRNSAEYWFKAYNHMKITLYDEAGLRVTQPNTKYCRITPFVLSNGTKLGSFDSYVVKGQWIPNALSRDINANKKQDILRCALLPAHAKAFYSLQKTVSLVGRLYLTVEIIKYINVQIKFQVPWHGRTTGVMSLSNLPLSQQLSANFARLESLPYSQQIIQNSMLAMSTTYMDPWARSSGQKKIFMCVPGVYTPLDSFSISHLFEFIEHHLALGIDHIFLGLAYPLDSSDMREAVRLFLPYLQAGQLSLFSQTDSGLPYIPSDPQQAAKRVKYRFALAGGELHGDAAKLLGVNLCLYYAKGLADYLAIWDVDEFFIPSKVNRTVKDIVADVENKQTTYCYMEVSSSTYFRVDPYSESKQFATEHAKPSLLVENYSQATFWNELWLGHHYRKFNIRNNYLSHKKALHSTDDVYALGLHIAGACNHSGHSLYHPVDEEDHHAIGKDQAVLYHVQYVRYIPTELKSDSHLGNITNLQKELDKCLQYSKNKERNLIQQQVNQQGGQIQTWRGLDCDDRNLYALHYQDKVLERLREKGYYDALMLLHDEDYVHKPNVMKYYHVYNRHRRGNGNDSSAAFSVHHEANSMSSTSSNKPTASSSNYPANSNNSIDSASNGRLSTNKTSHYVLLIMLTILMALITRAAQRGERCLSPTPSLLVEDRRRQ